MEAYVINLDSRPDRWKAIQERFKDGPLRLHRVSATRHPNGGYGLFLTLIKLLTLVRKKHLRHILILEDDCLPAPKWKTLWPEVQSWLHAHPEAWDIYTGGAWGGNATFQSITSFFGFEPAEIGRTKNSILFEYPLVTHGGHWLYIPNRSFTPLLNHYKRYASLVHLIPYFKTDVHNAFFKTITSYPFVAYQTSSFSNLERQFIPREKELKSYERRVGRQLRTRKRPRSED